MSAVSQAYPFTLVGYRLLTTATAPVAPLIISHRLKRGKEHPARRNERYGRTEIPRPAGPLVWIHCASVGELLTVIPLIGRLREKAFEVLCTSGTITSATNLTLRYDAKPPVTPGMTLLAQDSKIVVQLDPQGETLLRYEIQYAVAPADAGIPSWRQAANVEATKSSETITGLTNGVTYLVQAQSIDEVENASGYNTPQAATPQASNGFWGEYKDAGGHELGGCNVADAAVPSVLGALGVLVALIRRRR